MFVIPIATVIYAGMAALEIYCHVYIAQCIPTTCRQEHLTEILLSNDVSVTLAIQSVIHSFIV